MDLAAEIKQERARHSNAIQGLYWRALLEIDWRIPLAAKLLGMSKECLYHDLLNHYGALYGAWLHKKRERGCDEKCGKRRAGRC